MKIPKSEKMKTKLKQLLIPFIIISIVFYTFMYLEIPTEFGIYAPDVGLIFASGILFGPYGAIGASLAYVPMIFPLDGESYYGVLNCAITFAVAYLSYKIWYGGIVGKKITLPKLGNISQLTLFTIDLLVCGLIYSTLQSASLYGILTPYEIELNFLIYFVNFINIAFIFGIICIWLSEKIDFVYIPKISKRKANEKVYRIIFAGLIIATLAALICIISIGNEDLILATSIIMGILLIAYLTKPITSKPLDNKNVSIIRNITRTFLLTTLVIAILGIIFTYYGSLSSLFKLTVIENILPTLDILVLSDIIILLFFIPCYIILRYIEKRVINPISSFSTIEDFIKENEKIEAEGLVSIYSEYINRQDEIGKLARSYTELINHNNNYIENIREIEGEKKRIATELDIATRIQASNLPTEPIENKHYLVDGYSHPAKEVGGDFFDYYELDGDNLAVVIGDASGKGIPAALFSTITQVMIKQILQHEQDPSSVLSLLNNQIYENNYETMFTTLWLGIYNKKTKKITFSNAGHNPPIIKENDEYRYLDMDSGIVLGIVEDFEFTREEIDISQALILYTDGITDAKNITNEMYGDDRLLNFFKEFKKDSDPITPLLEDISEFTDGEKQYDDMTLLYLKNNS